MNNNNKIDTLPQEYHLARIQYYLDTIKRDLENDEMSLWDKVARLRSLNDSIQYHSQQVIE